MHTIEPYYNWQHLYIASEDERSPFYNREYSEFEYNNTIYNYLIHPQWDDIGSNTLYVKILFADYDEGCAIIELIGEWNDCLHNDVMFLKRDIVDIMINHGIDKFILIGENVLNFHASDDCYYQEWFDDIEKGWVAFVNFREHVLKEFQRVNIDYYIVNGGELDSIEWRTLSPLQLFKLVDGMVTRRLSA